MSNQYDKILVINSGSSSLKFMLFSMENETVLAKGLVERIGTDKPRLVYSPIGKEKTEKDIVASTHMEALEQVCAIITDSEIGVIKDLKEVGAVGHRLTHGGENIKGPSLCTEEVKNFIRDCIPICPLHNPANLAGILACEKICPGTPNVCVSDNEFHQTMPRHAYMYAIPMKFYNEDRIRKYGMHGTSHKFVMRAAADFLGKKPEDVNLVICHLGNGSSICAVKNGKSFDTSMGLTPLQGLMMGTRCGDIDPAVCVMLGRKGYSPDEIDTILNKESGFKAMNGINSADMRDTVAAAEGGSEDAKNALLMFAHRVALYVGGYYTLIGGADAVVFTGGIGENSSAARKLVVERLAALGCVLDENVNEATRGKTAVISTSDSRLPAIVIPTNEELMIARETYRVVTGA